MCYIRSILKTKSLDVGRLTPRDVLKRFFFSCSQSILSIHSLVQVVSVIGKCGKRSPRPHTTGSYTNWFVMAIYSHHEVVSASYTTVERQYRELVIWGNVPIYVLTLSPQNFKLADH